MQQKQHPFETFFESLETLWNSTIKKNPKLLQTIEENEKDYTQKLKNWLQAAPKKGKSQKSYKAEVISCIDPREKKLRTILESLNYKTYGYSGAFGIPLKVIDTITKKQTNFCPLWATPSHTVFCTPNKNGPSTIELKKPIPFEQQVSYAQQFLRTIGLTKTTAPFIILVGHKGELKNHPYEEGFLHCGACGGNPGEINNRIMVSILQNQDVRKALRSEGIDIPDNTICFAAEHTINTGKIILLIEDKKLESCDALKAIKHDFTIEHKKYKADLLKASGLSAQDLLHPSPHIGLAGNTTLFIGPIELIKNTTLFKEKIFLQSYDQMNDIDGTVLRNILTGALLVALSLNIQHLLSTVVDDNKDRIIPQSFIFDEKGKAHHSLMRFFVIVHAPKARLEHIIETEPLLQTLINQDWIRFVKW